MKRLIYLAIIALVLSSYIAYGVDHKPYNSTMPGMTYFVKDSSSSDVLAITNTNNEIEMWYPSKVYVYYDTAAATTSTLTHVKVIPREWIAPDTVTTNESGTVSTNHFHGSITNTTYSYMTNVLCTITNTTGAQMSMSGANLSDIYILKGDKLIWNLGITNSCWLGITGKR